MLDGRNIWKRKLPRARQRRKETVAEDETVLGIPPVAVVEPVDVGIPPVVVEVDVENRDALCHAPSIPPPLEYSMRAVSDAGP